MREQYAPFLRKLSPALPQERHKSYLDKFKFRFEEDEDRCDASRPYSDVGSWEDVTVPHYTASSMMKGEPRAEIYLENVLKYLLDM